MALRNVVNLAHNYTASQCRWPRNKSSSL